MCGGRIRIYFTFASIRSLIGTGEAAARPQRGCCERLSKYPWQSRRCLLYHQNQVRHSRNTAFLILLRPSRGAGRTWRSRRISCDNVESIGFSVFDSMHRSHLRHHSAHLALRSLTVSSPFYTDWISRCVSVNAICIHQHTEHEKNEIITIFVVDDVYSVWFLTDTSMDSWCALAFAHFQTTMKRIFVAGQWHSIHMLIGSLQIVEKSEADEDEIDKYIINKNGMLNYLFIVWLRIYLSVDYLLLLSSKPVSKWERWNDMSRISLNAHAHLIRFRFRMVFFLFMSLFEASFLFDSSSLDDTSFANDVRPNATRNHCHQWNAP